ncbi:MAG: sugar phosphate nucleotidyltransferase, partial [Allosphingosinicella sp.]
GRGTRLGALTRHMPKPLLEVGGRPFLDWLIEEVARHGIPRVTLLAGFEAERFAPYHGRVLRGARVEVLTEPEPLGTAGALRLFSAETPAGTRAELTAFDDGWLVVCAPGLPMAPEAQDTATPVTVLVQRARPRMVGHYDLPDPLADPILDLRVKSATAESYFVKAGDY